MLRNVSEKKLGLEEPPSTLGVAPATSELKQLMARCLSRINELLGRKLLAKKNSV